MLSQLTYNGGEIAIPQGQKLNIYMGIGLWSAKNGLTIGLPVDVMQMLLSAVVLRSQIKELNPYKPSKVIILIADSMAEREGADGSQVAKVVELYKKSLEPLLDLLNLQECSEIVLSSELEKEKKYQETLRKIEEGPVLQSLKGSEAHYEYTLTQTAITGYMDAHREVGVKVGWKSTGPNIWDEAAFDRISQKICRMSYLYAKAGLKQSKSDCVIEGCPYTAYEMDKRYVVQIENPRDISPIYKKVAAQWKGVAQICAQLKEQGIVKKTILPPDCPQRNNDVATVYKMLNYWSGGKK